MKLTVSGPLHDWSGDGCPDAVIDDLLMDKLPDLLDYDQKRNKIRNLLYGMSKKKGVLLNKGTFKNPIWRLS